MKFYMTACKGSKRVMKTFGDPESADMCAEVYDEEGYTVSVHDEEDDALKVYNTPPYEERDWDWEMLNDIPF